MEKRTKRFLIIGFLFTCAAGTLLHFVYEWSGQNRIIGLFAPVSESTWEHLKMLFFPAAAWAVSGGLLLHEGKDKKRLFTACAEGICIGLLVIVSFFYTYTGILGDHLLALDVLTFYFGVLATYLTAGRRLKKGGNAENGQWIVWALVMLMLTGSFFYFTGHVPKIGLFQVWSKSVEETVFLEEKPGAEETEQLTMEDLIRLCEDDGLRRLVNEQGLDFFMQYENLEEAQMEMSLTWMYTCNLPWHDREYILQVYFWMPGISSLMGHEEYEIDAIHLVESKTGDRLLLYSADPKYEVNTGIASFLEKQYGMDQYMTFELPEGFALGGYQADMAGFSGSLLTGDYEEAAHGDGVPESWYAPGGLVIIPREHYLNFENGELSDVTWLFNHSWMTEGPERLDCCEMPALLYEICFDLYTAGELSEYEEENGKELPQEEVVSKYWYVFMGKEDCENGYAVFLNERYFSRDDVIKFASSIHFLEE